VETGGEEAYRENRVERWRANSWEKKVVSSVKSRMCYEKPLQVTSLQQKKKLSNRKEGEGRSTCSEDKVVKKIAEKKKAVLT